MKNNMRVLTNIKDWIVSYLVILIVPIIICSVFYVYTYLIIWEEVNDSNEVALQIIASELDDVFERIFLLEYEIQRNSEIQECIPLDQPLDNSEKLKLVLAARELDKCVSGELSIITQCQVIYPKSEMVIRLGSIYSDFYTLFSSVWENTSLTYEEWEKLAKERHKRKIISVNGDETISYITSLPLTGKSLKMNVIFTLNSNYLQNVLEKLDNVENGAIILADTDNNILLGRNLEQINIDKLSEAIDPSEGYKRITIDNKDMMVSCIKLKNIDLRMISIIPYKVFWETALESLSTFGLALILCISLGVSASYGFSKVKQKTWGRINDIIGDRIDKTSNSGFSRNKKIAEAIDFIVEEYGSMQNQLVSVDKMKKELLIISALKGRIRANEIERVFDRNNVNFMVGNYALLLFKLNGFERFYDTEEQNVGESDILLIKQAIVSVLQELTQKDLACEILSIDEKIVCIVDFGNLDKDECYEKILQLAKNGREMTMERLSVLLTISVSDVHKHVFSLQNAYSEAVRVMEYQDVMDDKFVMTYMEMVKKTQKGYSYSLESESALIHWIYEGKEKEALQHLNNICEKNIVYINGSEELSKCLMWNLTASVLRAEIELGDKVTQGDMQDLLSYIGGENNLFEAKHVLSERIKLLCAEVNMKKGKKGGVIAERIKEYIYKSYANPNLDNNEIALQLGMHVNYVTTLFKEQTGVSLLTFIQKVRLEKAKELLENTDLTLEEISERIGCNNSVSVNRLFKKYENVTPAVYRRDNARRTR